MKTVSILIVTYNTGPLIRACLQNLAHLPAEVIVVDNASSDNTPQLIADEFPNVKLILNEKNLGFGAANNCGFKESTGDIIVLVNPDLLLTADALTRVVEYLEDHPDTAIVGPRTYDEDKTIAMTARAAYSPGRIWAKYWAMDYLFPRLVYGRYRVLCQTAEQPFDAAWLQGSCLAMPREIYQQLNGFDEGFFLFAEDTDLCNRALKLGKRVTYLPQASVIHHGSTTVSRYPLIRIRSYHQSPLYYFRKRNRPAAVLFLKSVFLIELLVKITLRSLQNIVRSDQIRSSKIKAERQVLGEVWKY